MALANPPAHNEIEISLFGPGYGECVVLHVGCDKWIIIDSCASRSGGGPAALNYFQEIGVDPHTDVLLIMASHWHDDHVSGLSKLLEECENAAFCCSNALEHKEFITLATTYGNQVIYNHSGIQEFSQILETLSRRGVTPLWTSAEHVPFERDVGGFKVRLVSLSPSNASVTDFLELVSELLPRESNRERIPAIPPRRPNHVAIATWLEIGNERILLGSDLEVAPQGDRGWRAILTEHRTRRSGEKANVFKVPHHGSENAHFDETWLQMLCDDPFAALTPFTRGVNPPPTHADLTRIHGLTKNAFITALNAEGKSKYSNRLVQEEIEASTRNIRAPIGGGHIRLRKTIESGDEWEIELFGSATALASLGLAAPT